MTVGRNTGISPVESGYSIFGGLGGALTPNEFVLDGTVYTVQFLAHSSEGLWLGIDVEPPVDFALTVDGSVYRGSESKVGEATSDGSYWWPLASLDWSEGDSIRVSLITRPGGPPRDHQKAPVTGYFRLFPPGHDGKEAFSFRIHFSEGVSTTADAMRDHVLSVSGGAISSVEEIGDEGRIWAVTVIPEPLNSVTVEIENDLECQLPAAICTGDGRRLFNRMELAVPMMPNSPATGAPTISGTVEAGGVLTADTSGIADANGLSTATFRYQWISYDGRAYLEIEGATGSTYTLGPTEAGNSFKVRVSFTDDVGYEESLTSALFGWDRPYGLTVSESDGAVELRWNLPAGWPGWLTFQVLRNRPELGEDEPRVHVRFLQTNANAYIDADVEPGALYVYRVKGVDTFGFTGEASVPVEIRTAKAPPADTHPPKSNNSPATGPPSIRGEARVGSTLRASLSELHDPDGLSGATFRYQWLADDTEIKGATGRIYTPDADDVGRAVTVRVSFRDDAGNEESLTSEPTAAVAP